VIGDTRCLLGDAALAPVVSLACRAASGSRGHPFAESEMLRDRPGRSQLFRVELHDGDSLVA